MRTPSRAVVVVGALALLSACGKPAETPAADEAPAAAESPAVEAKADDGGEAKAQTAALAALPAPYNAADLENGQTRFALCRSCHTLVEGGPNRSGPNLYGLFGRQAGSAPKFSYSQPVKSAGFAWDAEHLDKWLADPRGFLPGNRMSFPGVKDQKDRTDLIAYLMINTGYEPAG